MEGRMRQGTSDGGNVAKAAALLLGLGYVGIGVIGFAATGLSGFVADTGADILGFDLNIFHNVVHLAIGAGLVVASRVRDVAVTQGILMGVGLFYTLAAILGFSNNLQLISINDSLSIDNFFHLLTGVIALMFGLLGARQQDDSLRGRRTPTGRGDPNELRPIEERRGAWNREDTYRETTY